MVAWFRRGRDEPDAPPPVAELDDSPAALNRGVDELAWFVNANAGRLPNHSVVAARAVCDVLRQVIATSEARELNIHAVISVRSISTDYLPTTLRSYLAVDRSGAAATGTAAGLHRDAPEELMRQQIDQLWGAASDVLDASRAQDVDALATQGNFLRTKFSRSDLDL